MRREHIECKTAKQARSKAPWAAKVVKVEGGYLAFESIADWRAWANQR